MYNGQAGDLIFNTERETKKGKSAKSEIDVREIKEERVFIFFKLVCLISGGEGDADTAHMQTQEEREESHLTPSRTYRGKRTYSTHF